MLVTSPWPEGPRHAGQLAVAAKVDKKSSPLKEMLSFKKSGFMAGSIAIMDEAGQRTNDQ